MKDPQDTRKEVVDAINRCIEAYREVLAKLPKGAGYSDTRDNHADACKAYLRKLPILIDPQSFQSYISCVSHGASLGAIDPIDVGRFCHVAQTAMAAWKLVNLMIPTAENKEREATPKKEKSETTKRDPQSTAPHPSKGNQPEEKGNQNQDWEDLYAATKLPAWETQVTLFNTVRERRVPIPCNEDLSSQPAEALRYCEMGRYFLKCQEAAAEASRPQSTTEPAPAEQKQPVQAA
ncbi:MAG TPA: hypothetical protein VMU71_06350 [Terracidiphilus sp.]|nr:hypothetical protein [Terracidiphilus sp.]